MPIDPKGRHARARRAMEAAGDVVRCVGDLSARYMIGEPVDELEAKRDELDRRLGSLQAAVQALVNERGLEPHRRRP